MEEVMMDIDGYGEQQIVPNALPFAWRSVFEKKNISFVMFDQMDGDLGCWGFCFFVCCRYRLEALQKAISENTIAYLETASGKTLIAMMLLWSYACHLRKFSPNIAAFLVPKVILVSQVCKNFDLFYDNFAYLRCIVFYDNWWMIAMWWLKIHCACLFCALMYSSKLKPWETTLI
jgi:hypothetical protein